MERFRFLITSAAAGIVAGAAAGLGVGLLVALRQRYLALGLERLAGLTLVEHAARGWRWGAAAALAIALALLVRRRGATRNVARRLRHAIPAAAIVLVALFWWGRVALRPTAARTASLPDVILISIDTLRADRLGCYGYGRGTTPVLDAFAAEGARVTDCLVQAPWTLTSHMSMLTSLYPSRHGVESDRALDPREVTLAEVMRDRGYRTLGYARSCLWMDARYGFDQGFESYVVDDFGEDAAVENRRVAADLARRGPGPLFLFLHYFDVHSDFHRLPYDSPPAYRERFASWYRGPFDGCGDGLCASEYLEHVNKERIALPVDERRYISSLYDAGLAYLDSCLGDLFARLRDLGIYDDALIVVTGDHGEEFQEHGCVGHGNPLHHLELLHVPLLIKLPAGMRKDVAPPGAAVDALVESIDIAPTILDLAGVRPPAPDPFQGRSFAALLRGDAAARDAWRRTAFSDAGRSVSVCDGRWHLMTNRLLEPDRYRLYDVREDPDETVDVLGDHPDEVAALKQVIEERVADRRISRVSPPVVLSEEDRRRLRALGY